MVIGSDEGDSKEKLNINFMVGEETEIKIED